MGNLEGPHSLLATIAVCWLSPWGLLENINLSAAQRGSVGSAGHVSRWNLNKKRGKKEKKSPGSHPSSCYLYWHDFFGTRPCLDCGLSVCFTGSALGFLQASFPLVTLRLRSLKCWNQEWVSVRELFCWFGLVFSPCKLLFTFWLSCLINFLL